jgi:hypothetical protein
MELSPRIRFKLERLKLALRSVLGSKAQTRETAHRVCPSCRALIERNAEVCPFCGVPQGGTAPAPSAPGRVLGGLIPIPSTATSALVAANVGIYAVSWYLTQTGASGDLRPSPAGGGISVEVL